MERVRCPISDEPAEIIFSRPYRVPELQPFAQRAGLAAKLTDKEYEVRYCAKSGIYFQTLVMEDEELTGLYARAPLADSFEDEIGRQKLHWFGHMTEEILVMRQMVGAKRPVVLDFGTNWGKWASMALAHGCDVYGVDVNIEAAAFCSRRGIKMVGREELASLRFDFINVDQVLEHLSEPLTVARELTACLKPGRWMKWGTPDNRRLPQQLRQAQANRDNGILDQKRIDSLAPLEHVNLFSNGSLKFLAAQLGLQPTRLPFWKWVGAGQLWNLPRQLNRNFNTPLKRWRMQGTYLWVQKPG